MGIIQNSINQALTSTLGMGLAISHSPFRKQEMARSQWETALNDYERLEAAERAGRLPENSTEVEAARQVAYKAGRAYLSTASSRRTYERIEEAIGREGFDPITQEITTEDRNQAISGARAEEERRRVEESALIRKKEVEQAALERQREAESAERRRLLTPNTGYGAEAIKEFEKKEAEKWQGITQK